jgi:hypothetical protein
MSRLLNIFKRRSKDDQKLMNFKLIKSFYFILFYLFYVNYSMNIQFKRLKPFSTKQFKSFSSETLNGSNRNLTN